MSAETSSTPPVRRRHGLSPTARTLAWLRRHGYLAATVERWNAHARVRQDLFGFADVLAVGVRLWALQVCMSGDRTRRLDKLLDAPLADRIGRWLEAGGGVGIVAWTRHERQGRRRFRWSASLTVLDYGDDDAASTVGATEPQPIGEVLEAVPP